MWARLRRLLSLDSLFDALDELFEAGDNVDLTVRLRRLGCHINRVVRRHGHGLFEARDNVYLAVRFCWVAGSGCADACVGCRWTLGERMRAAGHVDRRVACTWKAKGPGSSSAPRVLSCAAGGAWGAGPAAHM